MGLFDGFKKRKTTSPVWRNSNGNIECPGDSCPANCDDNCPIWCQTLAIQAYQRGDASTAISYYRKALTLAPDFKDAWNNLAAVYGSMNNHLEANKAYKTAYGLDRNYKNALFGMIVSFKNLGQFEEALHYCDEFEQKFGKFEADKLRAQVNQFKQSNNVARQETAIEMASKIVDKARKDGLLGMNDKMPNIPEIMVAAKEVCGKIHNDLVKDKDGNRPDIWLAWGAYAGMGAVKHWDMDWDSLKTKGIAETLLEPRGSFAMDEYVVDIIGIGFETGEGKEFQQNIYNLSMWAFSKFVMDKMDNDQQVVIAAYEAMQAMYIFGMVLEMERLGMK